MIDAQYPLYAALFEMAMQVDAAGSSVNVDLHGNAAGAALRVWGASHHVDIVPEVIDGEMTSGSWTVLRAQRHGRSVIVVHLDDVLELAPRQHAEPVAEMEIPF